MSTTTKISATKQRYLAALASVDGINVVRFQGSPYGGHNHHADEPAEKTTWTPKEMGGTRKRAKVSHARAIVNSSSLWARIENNGATPNRRARRAGLPWCFES